MRPGMHMYRDNNQHKHMGCMHAQKQNPQSQPQVIQIGVDERRWGVGGREGGTYVMVKVGGKPHSDISGALGQDQIH